MKSDSHKRLQERVRDYYRQQGWIALIEEFVSGKKIDVLSQNVKTKYTIANEIQLSPQHFLENIRLDFRAGCDEVKIICIDKTVLERIRKKTFQELDEELLKKIKFQLIEEFIPLKLAICAEENPKQEGGEEDDGKTSEYRSRWI